MANFAQANLSTLKKTGSYYVMHILVAAAVAYAITGNLAMAFTLSLVEPTVQAFAFFLHEKIGARIGRRKPAQPQLMREAAAGAGAQ
jgi:uncharacterized membrane protein